MPESFRRRVSYIHSLRKKSYPKSGSGLTVCFYPMHFAVATTPNMSASPRDIAGAVFSVIESKVHYTIEQETYYSSGPFFQRAVERRTIFSLSLFNHQRHVSTNSITAQ